MKNRMLAQVAEASPLIYARVAGFLYLMLVPLGFLPQYVSSRLVVSGDAVKTASNIMASESLYRLGIVSALLVQVVNIAVVLILYKLLKPVNKNMALLMVIFILIDSFAAFLLPNYTASIAMLTFWGEVLFPLWLLIKGVNFKRWEESALTST